MPISRSSAKYDCTLSQTFSAFSDPELKGRWFAVPADWENRVWELDFRVGGGEVNSGGPPGSPVFTFKSRYHAIVPGGGSFSPTTSWSTSA